MLSRNPCFQSEEQTDRRKSLPIPQNGAWRSVGWASSSRLQVALTCKRAGAKLRAGRQLYRQPRLGHLSLHPARGLCMKPGKQHKAGKPGTHSRSTKGQTQKDQEMNEIAHYVIFSLWQEMITGEGLNDCRRDGTVLPCSSGEVTTDRNFPGTFQISLHSPSSDLHRCATQYEAGSRFTSDHFNLFSRTFWLWQQDSHFLPCSCPHSRTTSCFLVLFLPSLHVFLLFEL